MGIYLSLYILYEMRSAWGITTQLVQTRRCWAVFQLALTLDCTPASCFPLLIQSVATCETEGSFFPRSPCSAKVYHESGTRRSSYHRRLFFILHAIFSRCVCVALSRPRFKSYFPFSSLLIISSASCQMPTACVFALGLWQVSLDQGSLLLLLLL